MLLLGVLELVVVDLDLDVAKVDIVGLSVLFDDWLHLHGGVLFLDFFEHLGQICL